MTLNPAHIITIRHGETAWNVATRIQGSIDIQLNERGHEQALRVAKALRHESIQAIYSSDLWRAHDTAIAIGQTTGLTPIPTEGLRERLFGCFEGKTMAEIDALWPDLALKWRTRDPDFCPEGGESLRAFSHRIENCVARLAEQHQGETIVLVSHGGVNDVLYRLSTGLDIQTPRTWSLGNAQINRLQWTPLGFSLTSWGEASHLDDL